MDHDRSTRAKVAQKAAEVKRERLRTLLASRASQARKATSLYPDLVEEQTKLLREPLHHEVTIKCGDKTWNYQRAILAQRCDFFRAAFDHKFQEAQTETITLDHDNPTGIDLMLLYLYTRVPPKLPDFETAKSAYIVGDKYNLEGFKNAAKLEMLRIAHQELQKWHSHESETTKSLWIERVKKLWYISTTDSKEIKEVLVDALIPAAKFMVLHDQFKTFMSEDKEFLLALNKALADKIFELINN